jgi:hypothetical protein
MDIMYQGRFCDRYDFKITQPKSRGAAAMIAIDLEQQKQHAVAVAVHA